MTKKILALTLGLVLALAGAASAQVATGNIYGMTRDESGAVLPGVNVTLTSELGTRSTVSGPDGAFRFLSLTRGEYTVTLSLAGFASSVRKVRVTTGENVEIEFSLKVSGVAETVEVQAETPLVNTKKRGTSTTMTTEELDQVPNARDPWAVLKAVPGVLVDRVNIAGNENGQQAEYAAKGSTRFDGMWNLDGVVITDMTATGSSPTYFDYGAIQEIAVTTGGSDLSTPSGGVGINLTTKRGTNAFHGGARFIIAHDDLSFGNVPDSLANDPRLKNPDGSYRDKADHVQQITDYGFDLGGPIIKDKLWFYGTYGKQDIRAVRLIGTPDKTLLPSYNFKVNWQAASKTMVSGFYFVGQKQKFGRALGYPVQETDSFLWNQDNAYTEGGLPGGLWKLQIDQTFSPNFFMSAKVAYYDTGFGLLPRGGLDQSFTIDYIRGEAIGSSYSSVNVRPQTNVTVDGNYFFEGLGGNNELKFGFSWRYYKTSSGNEFGGTGLPGYLYAGEDSYAEITRYGLGRNYEGKYISGYIGDVLTRDRFTLNLGLRLDLQTAKNLPGTVPANKSFPDLLPALEYPGDSKNIVDWTDWSPRVGMSYALNESRRTVLRASYAYYAGQLSFADVTDINPVGGAGIGYGWVDGNGDRVVQPNEVQLDNFLYSYGVDLANPTVAVDVDRIDPDWKTKHDHEVVVAIDHELAPSLAVGVAYTFRKANDWAYRPRLGAACPAENPVNCRIIEPNEYTANAPTTANGYTAFTYSPNATLATAGGNGRYRTNRPGYSTSYNGLELTLTKRLANRWMSRVAFSWNDWVEDVSTAVSGNASGGNPTPTEQDPLNDGGQLAVLATSSGKNTFYSSAKWQIYANALWQGPLGLDLSGALFGRQGAPYPVSVRLPAGRDSTIPALATDQVDTMRLPDVWNFDLRLGKTFKLGGRAGLTLSAEWFNVFNSGTVLQRYRYANASAFTATASGAEAGKGRIEEILSPGIFRFGARFAF